MKKHIIAIALAILFSASAVQACDDSPAVDFTGYEFETDD